MKRAELALALESETVQPSVLQLPQALEPTSRSLGCWRSPAKVRALGTAAIRR